MKLLFIAAEPREFAGFPQASQPPIAGLHWCRSARLGTHQALLAANGAGAGRAAAATTLAATRFHPDAVISAGFCGALDPSLEIADIVIATVVQMESRRYTAQTVTCPRAHRTGPVITIDYIASRSMEKRRLRDSGSIAVEMEAAGVAGAAEVLGLPFYCIRTVTDLATEDMTNDFNAALRSDGHFDTMNILTGALRRPIVRVPELLRLRGRAVRAARSLGDFLIDCRF